mgnify:CR=1 FL=1
MSRALKRTVRPRLETEQGKGSACNSDWITAAGKPSLSHRINFRTITFLSQHLKPIQYLSHIFSFYFFNVLTLKNLYEISNDELINSIQSMKIINKKYKKI